MTRLAMAKANRWWRTGLLYATALLLCACETNPSVPELQLSVREPVRDQLIVAGDRAGPIYLGMPLRQVLEVLGDPQETIEWGQDGFPGMLYMWGDQWVESRGVRHLAHADISLTVRNADQRVRAIGVGTPSYQTQDGLRVGVSGARVLAILGPAAEKRSLQYGLQYCYRQGIHFGLDQTGTINWIKVFPAPDYPISWCHRVQED